MKDIDIKIEDLIRFCHSSDIEIRKGVASFEKTTKVLLERLSYDHDDVKIRVATNPNTSEETLDRLSSEKNKLIKQAVARNENISIFTIQKLAKEEISIRNELLLNKKLPKDFLLEFSNDDDFYIKDKALKLLKEIDSFDEKKIIESIEKERRRDILETHSKNVSSNIREAVAGNPNTPKEILKRFLFGDADHNVRNKAEATLKDLFKLEKKEVMRCQQ